MPRNKRKRSGLDTNPHSSRPGPSAEDLAQNNRGSHAHLKRIPKGPEGQCFLPRILPIDPELIAIQDADIIPRDWAVIDRSPNKRNTLGDPNWWAAHSNWLYQNRELLQLPEREWDVQTGQTDYHHPDRDDLKWVSMNPPNAECRYLSEMGDSPKSNFWVATALGRDRTLWWQQERAKREPEQFDYNAHIYYGGHAEIELVENALSAFNTAFSRQDKTLWSIWPELEGLAYFLIDHDSWCSRFWEDSLDQFLALRDLVGYALIVSIDYVGNHPERVKIRNLGLVFGLFFSVGTAGIEYDSDSVFPWIWELQRQAEMYDITFVGLHDLRSQIQLFNEDNESSDDEEYPEEITKFEKAIDWAHEYQEYLRKYGNEDPYDNSASRGVRYDVTQMTEAGRKAHRFSLRGDKSYREYEDSDGEFSDSEGTSGTGGSLDHYEDS